MRGTIAERFWAKVDKSGDCWEWTASLHHQWRYGHFRIAGKTVQAHRVAWELTHGVIPNGMLVCHRCDNPPCVRPDHLFLGTDRDNMRDRDAKGRCRAGLRNEEKTHCPQGHAYSPENTRVYISRKGWTMRFCVECARATCRANYTRNREVRRVSAKRATQARRERNPELFKAKNRDYMRACRARKRAASHSGPPVE